MLTCSDCPSPITRHNKSGRCKPCAFLRMRTDPKCRQKRVEALVEVMRTDGYRKKISERATARFRSDPEFVARFRAASKASRKGVHPACHSPEANAKRQASRLRTIYAWCPDRLISEYRLLVRGKGIRAPEARRMIEAEITPFERKLLAVKNGAPLIHVRPIRRAASSFSETGISTVYECG